MCIFFFHWKKSRTLEENVKNYRSTRPSLMYKHSEGPYNEKCKKNTMFVCLLTTKWSNMEKYGAHLFHFVFIAGQYKHRLSLVKNWSYWMRFCRKETIRIFDNFDFRRFHQVELPKYEINTKQYKWNILKRQYFSYKWNFLLRDLWDLFDCGLELRPL